MVTANTPITYRLSRGEETSLLHALTDRSAFSLIGSGSSRGVFKMKKLPECLSGLFAKIGNPLQIIVKVAFGTAALRQNDLEVRTFKKYGDEKLARIYAYGRFIIIMEAVKIRCDVDDYWLEDAEDCSPSEYYEDVFEWANSEFGETCDNLQIGESLSDGRACLYDYGFIPGSDHQMCGYGNWANNYKRLIKYINKACDIVRRKIAPNQIDIMNEMC